MKNEILITPTNEKALLVGVELGRDGNRILSMEQSLEELELLADTAGIEVLGTLTQKLDTPNPKTYIGSGKLEELKLLAEELATDVVIFDDELSPRHQRELEKELGDKIKLIDRTALILDIFAQHANTKEGMLQVELAQLEYRLPRLTRAWTHLARQAGGGGGRTGSSGGVGLRGPGEQQLELDRREIKGRIKTLKELLEKVREQRSRHRDLRRKTHIPVVSLVGYTNAGKSTLINRMVDTDIYVADQLFATLDPTTRQLTLSGGQQVLLTDTVGFIQKLPTQLVAAFRATLEEIIEADLLLHVVDISKAHAREQQQTVLETLRLIGADEIPVLTAYNKIDRLRAEEKKELQNSVTEDVCLISARTGEGIPDLLEVIAEEILSGYKQMHLLLPYEEGALVSQLHERASILSLENQENGIQLHVLVPAEMVGRLEKFVYIHKITNSPR
ncbi:MAG: GTPase HflX [Anaerolineaceae bacterium]